MLGTQLFAKFEHERFAARKEALGIDGHASAIKMLEQIGSILKDKASARNVLEGNGQGAASEPGTADNGGAAAKLLSEALIAMQAHRPGPAVHVLGNARHPFVEQLREELRDYGFTVAQIFWFFSELIRARKGLADILQSVKTEEDWRTLTASLTHAEDPQQWGFPHSGNNEVDQVLLHFVAACRSAGVTPSFYLLFAAASLLAHGHREAAQA